MPRFLSVFLPLIFCFNVSFGEPDTLNLRETEKLLITFGDSLIKGRSDSVRASANKDLRELMEKVLAVPESFQYGFDSLKTISTIKSPDDRFRFYCWVVPVLADNNYQVFGFLQLYDPKTKSVKVITLKDTEHDNYNDAKKPLDAAHWYGAVYYKVIPKKINKQTIYTLLGWRGVSNRTTKKIIDVLSLENDFPKFGAKIFSAPNNFLPMGGENGKKYRIIFEYNAQAVMSMNYDRKKDWILFDRIAPAKSSLKGMEEFYGPVFVIDAFKWEKGLWKGVADIDARNKTDNIPKDVPVPKKELRDMKQE